MRSVVRVLGALGALSLWPAMAQASPVLFTGTGTNGGVTLNASASFAVSGSTLTMTLRNTGDSTGIHAADVPANQLTGVFFDLPTGITLTPVSATINAGTLVQSGTCSPGPCTSSTTNVGGEFAYNTGDFAGHLGNAGISSSGYIGLNTGNFNGADLDNPAAPNGINFAIIAPRTATNAFNPNPALSAEPLIDGPVMFTMTIHGGMLTEQQISNVSFQYGTSITEPHFGGGGGAGQTVPEPGILLLVGPGVLAIARRVRSLTR